MIPFNKPYISGDELRYISQTFQEGNLSGNRSFTKKCQSFFEENYSIGKALMTTSCTDALEMSAILANIQPGDEVIIPSYTFVSTANAFVLRGAKIVFADSNPFHPGIDEDKIEELITSKTKAIVPVHYAGMSCNMNKIMSLANKYNLYVIEDAAQAIDNYFINDKGEKFPLGSIGNFGTFSFHETKNIISGEGGLLAINDVENFVRSEIIWEKGTNRSSFFRGEVDKYGWVDIGSSFLPAEMISAFLFAQLQKLSDIQEQRIKLWNHYYKLLLPLANEGKIKLPYQPVYSTNNAHMFYIVCEDLNTRNKVIKHLKVNGIHSVFHYLSLHKSPFFKEKYKGDDLSNSDKYSDTLIRLPLYYELTLTNIEYIVKTLRSGF